MAYHDEQDGSSLLDRHLPLPRLRAFPSRVYCKGTHSLQRTRDTQYSQDRTPVHEIVKLHLERRIDIGAFKLPGAFCPSVSVMVLISDESKFCDHFCSWQASCAEYHFCRLMNDRVRGLTGWVVWISDELKAPQSSKLSSGWGHSWLDYQSTVVCSIRVGWSS